MLKNTLQDIVINKNSSSQKSSFMDEKGHRKPFPPRPPRRPRSSNINGIFLKRLTFILFPILIIIFVVLTLTSRVVVEITPRSETKSINTSFPLAELSNNGDDVYQVVSVSGSMEKKIPSQGLKDIEKKATGEIVIFNDYNKSPQRLIARTRFETPNGLIFRIQDSATVPGKTSTGPGSIQVTVQADEPGEKYNIALEDFTVPGLKGTPAFKGVYARSKTPMTGGFSGFTKEISKEDEDGAREELKSALVESLKKKAMENVPEGHIMLDEAIFITFTEKKEEDITKENEPVTFILSADLKGIALEKKVIETKIARKTIIGGETTAISITNFNDLIFKLDSKNSDLSLLEETTLSFNGDAVFVWDIDKNAIQKALSGSPKDETAYQKMFIETFPNIIHAKVITFTPFWARKFPGNPDKIEIIEVLK